MSKRGEIVPELAGMLREIAGRIEAGTTTSRDALALQRLARQAAGEDRDWSLKVHGTTGQRAKGGTGVDQRLEVARRVKDYRAKHGGSLDAAFRALSGTFNLGPDSIKKAWQEMRPLLDMADNDREVLMLFKRFKASSDNAAALKRRG